VAVASAGPYANHMHLAPDRQPHQYLITKFFTDRMLFLTPNNSVKALKAMYTMTKINTNLLSTFYKNSYALPDIFAHSHAGNHLLHCLFLAVFFITVQFCLQLKDFT